MATESSVVVALREVRRLELDRQRREEEARLRALDEERARHEAQRSSIQFSGPTGYNENGQGWGVDAPESYARPPMRRTSELVPLAANGYGEPPMQAPMQMAYPPHQAPAPWEGGFPVAGPAAKPRSVFLPVVITMIVCGVGAAAGFYKLRGGQDEQARRLSMLESEHQKTESALKEAVFARSKAEAELKNKTLELQLQMQNAARAQHTQTTGAVAPGAPGAAPSLTSTAPVPAVRPMAAGKFPHYGLHRRAARAQFLAARAAQRAAAAKAAATQEQQAAAAQAAAKAPKVAKKKSVSDDPLGGLRL